MRSLELETPLGVVKKWNANAPLPDGWRALELREGRKIKSRLNQMIEEY